jgi:AraC family transcriptional regulator
MGQSATPPGNVLRGGEFFSPVSRRAEDTLFLITELTQPSARKIPAHTHDLASILLVLDGSYGEVEGRNEMAMTAFNAVFNPAGTHHVSLIGNHGTRLISIELRPSLLRDADDLKLPAVPVLDRGTGPLLWHAVKLALAWTQDDCDALSVESLIWEMLAGLSTRQSKPAAPAPWFGRVKQKMIAGFDHRLRMSHLASEAGVHPVHLAKAFRRIEGQTAGEYLQRLRVRAACDRLRNSDDSLANLAADYGFADQSHFTRTFRKIVGVTPAAFRNVSRPKRVLPGNFAARDRIDNSSQRTYAHL